MIESQTAQTSLVALQCAFAASIRDGEVVPTPGDIPEARMAVYRELFLHNITGALESAFPVACEVLPAAVWDQLVRQFWREHRSSVPEYPRLAGEFLRWFDAAKPGDLPLWLQDLLVWEFAELEAMLALDDEPAFWPELVAGHERLERSVVTTLSLGVFAFEWPVHRISPGWIPEQPEQVFLACFRNRALDIEFMELTPMSAALLGQFQATPSLTLTQQIAELAASLGLPPEHLAPLVADFVDELTDRGVIVNVQMNAGRDAVSD